MILSDKFICSTGEISTLESRQKAPWFKKTINISKAIAKAEITVCGLGFYELFLNGKKITKGRLSPYISNSDDIIFYDNYDLTDMLVNGDNTFEFLLGNGMQNCFGGFIWDFEKANFCSSPKLAFAAEVLYSDGSKDIVEADDTVLTKPSKIISNDLRLGEIYDAAATDEPYAKAMLAEPPRGEKVLSAIKPIMPRMELKPVRFFKENDSYIYDFGYNASGICKLNVSAHNGQIITLDYCEILHNGSFSNENLTFDHSRDKYFQQDVYICKEGQNNWEPLFTYHGFRYVKVSGITEGQADSELLTFVVFNTALDETGGFSCSDETLNRLNEMSLNSTLSNFHHFPTDCPHREKNGWTADAALSSAHTLLYFDPEDNYKQWLKCICKAQRGDGALPGIVPTAGWGFDWGNGPAWDAVLTELPYQIWQMRNDLSAFEECAGSIIKYIGYLETRLNDNGLLAIGLGDWCAPHDPIKAPLLLTDSIEAFDISTKAAKMFGAVNDKASAERCQAFADKIRAAVRDKLFNKDSCVFEGDCQTSQAMGIYYGLVDETETERAMAVLLNLIKKTDYHIDTGVLGGRVLFHVLAEHGEIDTALRILKAPTAPSYIQWIDAGNTTLCEGFYEHEGLNSRNHHFWGNISAFFMQQLCGIKPRASRIFIEPHFPKDIDFANAHFDSIYGRISIDWTRTGEDITVNVQYPERAADNITVKMPETGHHIIKTQMYK